MNENPEGTPNPLNPAPGTENETAAGTGLDFVETEQTSEVMSEPETPAAPVAPETPEAPVAPEATETPGVELGEIKESDFKVEPASFAEAAEEVSVNTAPKDAPIDPVMQPVSHNNFDTFGMDNSVSSTAPVEEIKEDTFVRAEVSANPAPISATPVNNTPELVAKDSIVEPVGGNGKKKALIIGAVVLALIAIICGVAAAVVMLMSNNDDRVTKAIDKLINGEVSTIIAAEGSISASSADANISTDINFKGTFDLKTPMNEVSATVKANMDGGVNLNLAVNEMRNKDGDTYFKLSGLTDMLGDNLLVTDCGGENSDLLNCQPQAGDDSMASSILSMYSGLFEVVDDEWILVSDDFGDAMSGLGVFENDSTCLINAFGSLPKYSKDIANKYKSNPFITYSTDKLGITKKQNPLYKLGIDENKLTAFINSLSNSGFVNELNACAGDTATNASISVDAIKEIFDGFPTIYVEIDDNYNFTRVYLGATAEGGGVSMDVTADLKLSYPTGLTVEDPDEYTDMSTLLNMVITNFLYAGSTL